MMDGPCSLGNAPIPKRFANFEMCLTLSRVENAVEFGQAALPVSSLLQDLHTRFSTPFLSIIFKERSLRFETEKKERRHIFLLRVSSERDVQSAERALCSSHQTKPKRKQTIETAVASNMEKTAA